MQQLYEIRKLYGNTFVTAFDDGFLVPWRPLTMGDYITYSQDRERGLIPSPCLEDEIFVKCVQDQSILRQKDFLKAGIVSTVVINIWQFSGPTSIDSFNNDLETARQILNFSETKAIHQLVQIITMAFPYKPEEVYDMPYDLFMLRLAQSESKLLQLGLFLKEPIYLAPEKPEVPEKKAAPRPKVDAKKLWDEQQQPQQKPNKRPPPVKLDEVKTTGDKWWTKSPVLEAPNPVKIDFAKEAREQMNFGASGHEKADIHVATAQMVNDAQKIYADLIGELKKRKT